ncbi:hypothetical protein HZ84_003966 [Escherichia coli]|nr:hypothetical protein [Escherichia coli]EIQ9245602.1 hypothetical protein [Escherichia coli]
MTTQPIEHSEQLKKCLEILKVKVAEKAEISPDTFPDKKTIHTEEPVQLAIIAEQAERLAELKPKDKIFGLEYHESDHQALMKLFLDDLVQFTTQHNINLGFNIRSYGQRRISEHAFYHLAVSPLLPATYKSIEQHGGRVFEIYSIPFKIRAALELKLSSIVGFEHYEVMRDGKALRTSAELPFSRLLKALQAIDCLELPCSLDNIKNVYQWACDFCHTGEKEYLWLTMKALEIVSPLFIWKEQKKAEVTMSDLWPSEGMSEKEKYMRLINFQGFPQTLYYFREGWSVQKLQDTLNEMEESKRIAALEKNRNIESWVYHLSETKLAEANDYYCDRTKNHY